MIRPISIKIGDYKVLVDELDYIKISHYKWSICNHGYATTHLPRTKDGKPRKHLLMHRLIMDAVAREEIDHINGDKLDNRKSNLRRCTRSENKANVGLKSTNQTGVKGVNFDRFTGRWLARITVRGKQYNLGRYNNIEDAAKAYNKAAINHFGSFARLNNIQGATA